MHCGELKNVNQLSILIILLKHLFAFINCALAVQRTSHFNMNLVDFWCPLRAHGLDITKARLVMQNRNDPYQNRLKHMRIYSFG